MSEGIKRRDNRKTYNQAVVRQIVKKYGVTKRFVHLCLNNERHGDLSESIVKDYKRGDEKVNSVLKGI